MAPTGSLIPAQIDLHGVSGADFAATVNLYQDAAQTTPFDLTGFTVTLVIGNGLLVLVSGAGLDLTGAVNGTLTVNMIASTTATLPPNQAYYLKLVDGSGTVSFPIHGTLTLLTP